VIGNNQTQLKRLGKTRRDSTAPKHLVGRETVPTQNHQQVKEERQLRLKENTYWLFLPISVRGKCQAKGGRTGKERKPGKSKSRDLLILEKGRKSQTGLGNDVKPLEHALPREKSKVVTGSIRKKVGKLGENQETSLSRGKTGERRIRP